MYENMEDGYFVVFTLAYFTSACLLGRLENKSNLHFHTVSTALQERHCSRVKKRKLDKQFSQWFSFRSLTKSIVAPY